MIRLLKTRAALIVLAVLVAGGAALYVVRSWLLHRILPDLIERQLSQAMNREIVVGDLGMGFDPTGYFSVSGLKIAKGKYLKDGTMIAAKGVVIRFKFLRLIFHPTDPAGAVKRIELEEPYVELDLADMGNGKAKKRKKKDEPEGPEMAGMPRTYLDLRGGTIILKRHDTTLMEIRRIKGNLDMRDFPRVEGNLKITIPPECTMGLNGYCHFSLKSFGGEFSMQSLDLAKVSEVVSAISGSSAVRVGGLLTAEVELRGGFMSAREFIKELSGRGSLKLEDASVFIRGAPLLSEAFVQGQMEERVITLESLSARMLEGALNASGRITDLGLGNLKMKGRLERVPLRALKVLAPALPASVEGETSLEFSLTGTGRAPVVNAKLVSPMAGIAGIRLEGLTAVAVGSPEVVRLTELRAKFWDGELVGGGEVTGWTSGAPNLNFDLTGKGLNVAKSPLAGRYDGRADLNAKLDGPVGKLHGKADLKITQVHARGIKLSDITVKADMEGKKIGVSLTNELKNIAVKGTLVTGGPEGIECEGCRLELQNSLPKLLALGGIEPPKGFDGRGNAVIRVEGPLKMPVITAEAFASGVRFGKMAIGDQIRVPRLVFKNGFLTAPATAPIELSWIPQNTRLKAWGSVPVALFTGKGDQKIAFHFETINADMEVLHRLGFLKEANGNLTLATEIAGTASWPVVWSMTLNGSGKRMVTNGQIFSKPIDRWNIAARVVDNEGILESFEVVVDKKEKFGIMHEPGRPNRFVLAGRALAALDVGIETRGPQGLPIVVEDMAELRLKASVRAVKEVDSEELWITGTDTSKGAWLELSNGKVVYSGGGGGGGKKKEKEGEEPAKPSAAALWLKRSLCVEGTIAFGKNLRYKPASIYEKLLMSAFTGKDSVSKGGISGALRDALLEFDVSVKEGSSIRFRKTRDSMTASGKISLEPGGKLYMRTGISRYEFTLVDEQKVEHYMEFLPGDELAANVSALGEIVFRNVNVRADDNTNVSVEEFRIRVDVSPPDEVRDSDIKRTLEENKSFLRYTLKLRAEPDTVTGQVIEEQADTAAGAGAGAPGGGAGGGAAATASAPVARNMTFKPSQRAILLVLTGVDKLAAAAGDSGITTLLKDTGVGLFLDIVVARPIKWALDFIGLRPDVLRVQKSDLVEASSASQQRAGSSLAPGGASTGGAQATAGTSQMMAEALNNSEITIGKNVYKNVYMNWHGVLLDASSLLGSQASSQVGAQRSNMWGNILELEYRTNRYKVKTRYRAFGLPDDPNQVRQYEGYGGVEISQPFRGVGQRDKFVW
jgi:hypothetical protein